MWTYHCKDSIGSNDPKEWISIRVSKEFVGFILKNHPDRKLNSLLDEALSNHITNDESLEIKPRTDLDLLVVGEDKAFIIDPYISEPIRLECSDSGRICCHYHNFIYTDCPHTIWATNNKKFANWYEKKYETKIPLPFRRKGKLGKVTCIRRKYYNKIEKTIKWKNYEISDVIANVVLNHFQ